MMGLFVPLLSLTIILLLIIVAFKLPSLWRGKVQHDLKWKMIIGYIGILVFGMIIYFSIVQPNFAANEQHTTSQNIHDFLYEDEQMDELPSQYIIEEWTVSLEEGELHVVLGEGLYDSNFFVPIVVDERVDAENRAEITIYETPSLINGMDISNEIELADIQLKGSDIIVSAEDHFIELNYYSTQNEMTVTQFTKDKHGSLLDIDFDLEIGEQVIAITIPKNTTLHVDEDLFHVVYK